MWSWEEMGSIAVCRLAWNMAKALLSPTTLFFLPFAGGPGYGEGMSLSPGCGLIRVRVRLFLAALWHPSP